MLASGMDKFAFFGPTEKHCTPLGGFCISVFAIIKKGKGVLVVRPAKHTMWEEWAPNWRVYSEEGLAAEFSKWRFPSSYVKFGEHPDDTLARVMKDQLGISGYKVTKSSLLNYYTPSRRYPGEMHWDYCFVYEVEVKDSPAKKPWFDAMEFVPPGELDEEKFGSAQGTLLELLNS